MEHRARCYMKCNREDMLLYTVTDKRWVGESTLANDVELAIKGGATFVQYREKDLPYEQAIEEAKLLKAVCDKYGVPFVINDDVNMAVAIDADGVHVGQEDMEAGEVRAKLGPDKIIGVTAKTVEQAVTAEQSGADYLGVGAVFQSGAKSEAMRITHETLRDICAAVEIPVVAIGGVNGSNVGELKGTGMDGVAVVSAIFAQDDIEEATRELKGIVEEVVND